MRRRNSRRCASKIRHASRAAAQAAADSIRSANGSAVTPYKCVSCGGWHNGHAVATGRRP